MINAYFNKLSQILEINFTGEIYATDLYDFISSFKTNQSHPKELKGLITATDTIFKFSINDLRTFNQAKAESLEHFDMAIIAIVINDSSTAAMSTLFQFQSKSKKFKFNIFSTHEAAKFWLDSYNI
ncbi:hypothetical protein KO493_08195 [Tamlana agarivorans]|uniref:Uncharacterized protein n=1 Tax=Pseudotamlana agarivorans TaxID=481183 RepID=A0ACC5U8L7_9FLAO|nr:hypothetical protein [Tamlana agarivorans]MBU2950673.1 hypothetical protein [Tamlana agarivorans]